MESSKLKVKRTTKWPPPKPSFGERTIDLFVTIGQFELRDHAYGRRSHFLGVHLSEEEARAQRKELETDTFRVDIHHTYILREEALAALGAREVER